MGHDDLPRFPTPGETFGTNQRPQRRPPNQYSDDYFASQPPPQQQRPRPQQQNTYQSPYPTEGQPMYGQYGPSATPGGPGVPLYGGSGGNAASGRNSYPAPSHTANGRRVVSPRTAQVPISSPESNLRALFNDVDRNKSGFLTEAELKVALVNGDYTRFDRETVKLMIRMFDINGDGAIHYDEFAQLWRYLHEWRVIFNRFDRDRSDSISLQEFHTALSAFGYNLSPRCIEYIFSLYAKLDRRGIAAMSFDMFVQSCIHIKSVTESFKKFDTDRDGYITLAFEQFLVEVARLR